MLYTVKEVSEMSNVTIKTLHHYHKIGLLMPSEISEAGYRLYGIHELQRLQEILLYRELEFSLDQIKHLLNANPDRQSILQQQEALLLNRRRKLDTIIETIALSIHSVKEGTTMDNKQLFAGFENGQEWNKALLKQNEHLQETYGIEPLQVKEADVPEMNEQAAEAMTFMNAMASALTTGIRHHDQKINKLISDHLDFLNKHNHNVSAETFAAQIKFFFQDEFHLNMLESQQIGLAYYLAAAAEAYKEESDLN